MATWANFTRRLGRCKATRPRYSLLLRRHSKRLRDPNPPSTKRSYFSDESFGFGANNRNPGHSRRFEQLRTSRQRQAKAAKRNRAVELSRFELKIRNGDCLVWLLGDLHLIRGAICSCWIDSIYKSLLYIECQAAARVEQYCTT